MKLNDYQKRATKTAIYPGQKSPLGLVYVALKLNGEAGEFAEGVGKAIRDEGFIREPFVGEYDDNACLLRGLRASKRDYLMKELGDILWYISAACDALNTTLEEIANINLEKLEDRQKRNKLKGAGDNR